MFVSVFDFPDFDSLPQYLVSNSIVHGWRFQICKGNPLLEPIIIRIIWFLVVYSVFKKARVGEQIGCGATCHEGMKKRRA